VGSSSSALSSHQTTLPVGSWVRYQSQRALSVANRLPAAYGQRGQQAAFLKPPSGTGVLAHQLDRAEDPDLAVS